MQVVTEMDRAVFFLFAALSGGGFFGGLPVAHGTPCSPNKKYNKTVASATVSTLCCGQPEVDKYNAIYQGRRAEGEGRTHAGSLSITRDMERNNLVPNAEGTCDCTCDLDSFNDALKENLKAAMHGERFKEDMEKSFDSHRGDEIHKKPNIKTKEELEANLEEHRRMLEQGLMTQADWEKFYRAHMDHLYNQGKWSHFDENTKATLIEDEIERMRILLTKKRRQMANMPKYAIANKGSMLYKLANKGFTENSDGAPSETLVVPSDEINKDTDNPILAVSKQWYKAAAKVWRKVAPISTELGGQSTGKEFNGTDAPNKDTWEAMKKNFIAETATDWMNKVQEFKILSTKFRQSAEGIYNEIVRAHNVLTAMQVNTLPKELEAMERPKNQYHSKAGFQLAITRALGNGEIDEAHKKLQSEAEAIANHAFNQEKGEIIKEFSENQWKWRATVGALLWDPNHIDLAKFGGLGEPQAGAEVNPFQIEVLENEGRAISKIGSYMEDPSGKSGEEFLARMEAKNKAHTKKHEEAQEQVTRVSRV